MEIATANKKMTFVNKDASYRMTYTPQRVYANGNTRLAKFDLEKYIADRGDLGAAWVLVNGMGTNYKPSRAFPLDGKITEVMNMLITDFNAAEWFAERDKAQA